MDATSGEALRDTWVVDQPAWGVGLFLGFAVVGIVGGSVSTVASGGRASSPLVAVGPVLLLFGLATLWIALTIRHGRLTVSGDTYSVRRGVRTRTTSLDLSRVRYVRWGRGQGATYVTVGDGTGLRLRIDLGRGDRGMRAHVATRLLASRAVMDPPSLSALRALAGVPDGRPRA